MLHTLLVALAVVGGTAAVVALCIIVTRRQTRRKNQQLKDTYNALLAKHNIRPEFSQVFEHRIFALDTSRGIFVVVQNNEAHPSAVIELSDVGDCRPWKDGVQISRKKGTRAESVEEYISAVGISFVRKNGIALNIATYTEALDGIEEKAMLTKAAGTWLQRIKAALTGISNTRKLTPAL